MKLSCADYAFPLLPHEHAVNLVGMLGVPEIDIGFMGGRSHVRPEETEGNLRDTARSLLDRTQQAGLNVADLFLIPWTDFETMAPNHPSASERDRAREMFRVALDFAVEIDSPGVTLLPGILWSKEESERSFERAVEELAWRADLGKQMGKRVSVEPHVGSLIEIPEEAERLAANTPDLRLTLDPSHFVFRDIAQDRWEKLVNYAGHVHLRGACPGRVQAPMAANAIDLPRLVEALGAVGYDQSLTLEYVWTEWERCNECDNVSETALLRDELSRLLAGPRPGADQSEAAS